MRTLRRRLDQLAQHVPAINGGEASSETMTAEQVAAATAAIARNRRLEPRDQLRALELCARLTGQLNRNRPDLAAPPISEEEAARRITALLDRERKRSEETGRNGGGP